ncbi:MAG TPA: hydroxysqualene dehydroxylase HpnE, partial [Myxococcota bacterium]|nr:hydroxysqualene dehydroxylase HpnE [Myxococcota bacterium]
DNGQHVFLRCCDRYLAFLDRLGVRSRVVLQPRLAVPVARPGRALAWIRRAPLPAPAHLAPSLLRFPALSLAQRVRAALTARRFGALDPESYALDRRSLGDWLREQGESDASIDTLWDLLIRPTLNLPARDASLALAARVMRTGFLERAAGADIGWPAVPFSALHAEPAAAALRARGVRVDLGARADAIECDAARPALWSHGARLAADAIVLATPHDEAAQLLHMRSELRALAQLGHSPIVNLHVLFDRRVLSHPLLAALDSPLQWIFDRTHSARLNEGQYLTASLSAADRWQDHSTAELRAIFLPAFAALLPLARDARVLRFAVTREPAATFRAAPGTRRLRPAPGSEYGGVFLAGAYTDTGWPATMESAVRSGLAAASAALAACARRGRPTAKEAA